MNRTGNRQLAGGAIRIAIFGVALGTGLLLNACFGNERALVVEDPADEVATAPALSAPPTASSIQVPTRSSTGEVGPRSVAGSKSATNFVTGSELLPESAPMPVPPISVEQSQRSAGVTADQQSAADYIAGISDLVLVNQRTFSVDAKFFVSIRNLGGTVGDFPLPVEIQLDDQPRRTLFEIEEPIAGEHFTRVITRAFGPGKHVFRIRIGDFESIREFEIKGVDFLITLQRLERAAGGETLIPVTLTNSGDFPARLTHLVFSAKPANAVWTGSKWTFENLGEFAPGERKTIDLRFSLDPGPYEFEAFLEWDGGASEESTFFYQTIDFSDPEITFVDTRALGYGSNGNAEIELLVQVRNDGGAATGPRTIHWSASTDLEQPTKAMFKLPLCLGQLIRGCLGAQRIESVPSWADREFRFRVSIPPGRRLLTAALMGVDASVQSMFRSQISIRPRPEIQLEGGLDARVLGYWSDGFASVRIRGVVENTGSRRLREPVAIRLQCVANSNSVARCDRAVQVALSSGFGPDELVWTVRLPMGSDVDMALWISDHRQAQFNLKLPARILGVDRDLWNCYSDRSTFGQPPEIQEAASSCSGWTAPMVQKWDASAPIRIWTQGLQEYRQILSDSIDYLAPILGLEFEFVDSDVDADVRAYVGVPRTMAAKFDFEACRRYGRCAFATVSESGEAISGTLIVWGSSPPLGSTEGIRGAIIHELLHVFGPIDHRDAPDQLMGLGGRLSRSDVALLRLNSHPLIKPGMTMDHVRSLIVLTSELLDAA